MSVIETRGLTKVYRTYRKEGGLRGSIKGLVKRTYQETSAADDVSDRRRPGRVRVGVSSEPRSMSARDPASSGTRKFVATSRT